MYIYSFALRVGSEESPATDLLSFVYNMAVDNIFFTHYCELLNCFPVAILDIYRKFFSLILARMMCNVKYKIDI